MRNIITTLILFPTLFVFASFTSDGIRAEQKTYVIQAQQTYKEFIQEAYSFYKKNGIAIPDHYYEVLGIEDPNTPAWVKAPAIAVPKLRDSVPLWVRSGILATESRSYYNENGNIHYTDKRRGKSVDIGPFQMRRIAFNEVKKSGESFWNLEKDMEFAEELACRYLLFIYNGRGNKNWTTTVMMYNTGPYVGETTSRGCAYLNAVRKNGK